jgi:hypothetical protein
MRVVSRGRIAAKKVVIIGAGEGPQGDGCMAGFEVSTQLTFSRELLRNIFSRQADASWFAGV